MLLRGLPQTANVWREENGGWSVSDHLLATIAEQANFTARAVLSSIPQRNRRKSPDALVIPRPGPKPKKRSWGDLARSLTGRR